MPGFVNDLALHDYFAMMSSKSLSPQAHHHDSHLTTPGTPRPGRAPILIVISAHALGSLGYALSLLVIWFGWLVPSSASLAAVPGGERTTSPPPPTSTPSSSTTSASTSPEMRKARLPPRHPRRRRSSSKLKESNTQTQTQTQTRRRVSAPVDLTPILHKHKHNTSPDATSSTSITPAAAVPRRVYFADADLLTSHAPIIRRNTMPESASGKLASKFSTTTTPATAPPSSRRVQILQCPLTSSPRSSTSTLPSSSIPGSSGSSPVPTPGDSEERAVESDSSRQSLCSTSRRSLLTQRLKLGFRSASSGTARSVEGGGEGGCITGIAFGKQVPLDSPPSSGSQSEKTARRSSWLPHRSRTLPESIAAGMPEPGGTSPTPSPPPSRLSFSRRSPVRSNPHPQHTAGHSSGSSVSELLSQSFLNRKSHRRVSAPIPRTSPYEAPYFATPPDFEVYQGYVWKGRGGGEEGDTDAGERGRKIKRVALGEKKVGRRRSTSEEVVS